MSKKLELFVVVAALGVLVWTSSNVVQEERLKTKKETPISTWTLKNITYQLGENSVDFHHGEGFHWDVQVATIGEAIAYGDYDHDGWKDAAVLITGKDGTTWLALVRNAEGTAQFQKAIKIDFLADGVEFNSTGTIRVTQSSRYGSKLVVYGYADPYLWKAIG